MPRFQGAAVCNRRRDWWALEKRPSLVAACAAWAAGVSAFASEPVRTDLEPVWAGHPVGFCLLTEKDVQFAAYYNAERQMTVAQRRLGDGESKWTFTRLPSVLGWDSHNYVTMAVDGDGFLHLAGNMHVAPMTYFRSRKPLDASTLEPVRPMARAEVEKRCTYPRFLTGPDGALLFKYRDGRSGQGNDILNRYDLGAKRWVPLMDSPLTDGLGKMCAYFSGPDLGPDGRFHVCGVWRDTGDCATNHHLSYARSKDLVHWETAAGKPLKVPLSLENIDVVDAAKPGQGLINVSYRLGFDNLKRPIVAYHRYDESGESQVFCSRFEDGRWIARPVTRWKGYRWSFSGGGSIPNSDVHVGSPVPAGEGKIEVAWSRPKESGTFLLDEKTLESLGKAPGKPSGWKTPQGFGKIENPTPGMLPQRAWDQGKGSSEAFRYALVWETLGANRDKPRPGPVPPPSMLRVWRLESATPSKPGK